MDLIYIKNKNQEYLRIVNEEKKDLSFFNLLRRILLQTTEFHAITEVSFTEYTSNASAGEIQNRLGLLPVKGEGLGRLSARGPKKVTSSDIVAEFQVVPNIDIIELKEGENIAVSVRSSLTNGREDPGKIPYVMRREGKDYILVPLSELYNEEDCKRDIIKCVKVVEKWIKLN